MENQHGLWKPLALKVHRVQVSQMKQIPFSISEKFDDFDETISPEKRKDKLSIFCRQLSTERWNHTMNLLQQFGGPPESLPMQNKISN